MSVLTVYSLCCLMPKYTFLTFSDYYAMHVPPQCYEKGCFAVIRDSILGTLEEQDVCSKQDVVPFETPHTVAFYSIAIVEKI